MKTYQITITSAAGKQSYSGLFNCSVDAICDALDKAPTGARISVRHKDFKTTYPIEVAAA